MSSPFKLGDAPLGMKVVTIEPIEDEFRWRYFERREGVAKFSPKYVPVWSERGVQGRPGMKPRWDSGEVRIASEMPANALVHDARSVSHVWTEARDGLMIVDASGWLGFYLHQQLLHVVPSAARPYSQGVIELAEAMGAAMGVAVGHGRARGNGGPILPPGLSSLQLWEDDAQTE